MMRYIFLVSLLSLSGILSLNSEDFTDQRRKMIQEQIKNRGVTNTRVLDAMFKVERHLFVPPAFQDSAYADHPVPIGFEQTISQPFIVAFMTEAMELQPTDRVLEIGTGSGYQAAVLGEIVEKVYTIEIIPQLADRAREALHELGYKNIQVKSGDGYQGWPEAAPFDAIIVTAAPPEVPQPLLEQLKVGGRLVIPVGDRDQRLYVITKLPSGFEKREILPVRFVPMVPAYPK